MCDCGGSTDYETGIYEPNCSHLDGCMSGRGLGRVGQSAPVLYVETGSASYLVHHWRRGCLSIYCVADPTCLFGPTYIGTLEVTDGSAPDFTKAAWVLDGAGVSTALPLDEALCHAVGCWEEVKRARVVTSLVQESEG